MKKFWAPRTHHVHSIITIVSDNVLYPGKFQNVQILNIYFFYCSGKEGKEGKEGKGKLCKVMDMLANLMVIIISHYTCLSNRHVVHLKPSLYLIYLNKAQKKQDNDRSTCCQYLKGQFQSVSYFVQIVVCGFWLHPLGPWNSPLRHLLFFIINNKCCLLLPLE